MSLRFASLSHAYGDRTALNGVTLQAEAGDILCLLGQSGCGKTTLLNLAAGILPVQSGEIHLDETLLASPSVNPPPEKRPIGLVFQEGALFPHLTVAQNIGFGVRDKADRARRVPELLDQIGLTGFGDRYPHTLSGGQRQRVAVARALAPEPRVLLMDEPFANIDIMLRKRLREEMRRLLKERGCVSILVTHDPEEAIETSDQIAVMEKGHIIQQGTADNLYWEPASLMVGLLTGEGSVISGRRNGDQIETEFGHFALEDLTQPSDIDTSDPFDLLIRPGTVSIERSDSGPVIVDIRRTGDRHLVTLESPSGSLLLLHVEQNVALTVGQHATLKPQSSRVPAFRR